MTSSCLVSTMMSAQFEVQSTGFSTSSNLVMDGVMGVANGTKGVLTVTSNRTDPNYSPLLGWGLKLIQTDSSAGSGIYPFSNVYRDKMNFYVTGAGRVYSVSGFLQPSATRALTRSASPAITSSLEKLKNVNGVVYTPFVETEQAMTRSASVDQSEYNAEPDSAMSAQILSEMAKEENLPRFGLVAQELEQVFPEVVRTLADGSKGIMYTDLIPVLIESIKELQVQVSELQSQLADATPKKAPGQVGESGNNMGQADAQLYQNTPNPFNQETEIGYRLPVSLNSASVCIYNLNGQQLKKYPLSVDSLNGKVTLSASEFAPGIYIYSLVINNQVVDSKRMTLTD